MLGQVVGRSGTSSAGSRCFRYEVIGLRQNEETDGMNYAIRSSASTFITVPYSRMNEEMQRISRMGGKIVSIQPVDSSSASAEASAKGK